MGQNLMQASREWHDRPADERFENIGDLYLHTLFAASRAKQTNAPTTTLKVREVDGDIRLINGKQDVRFNNWSFTQLSRRVGAPTDWLRRIPTALAVENFNHALSSADSADLTQLWVDNDTNVLRAATSDGYSRILNHQVVKAVIDLGDDWMTPPARPAHEHTPGSRRATAADLMPNGNHPTLGIKEGDWIAPAGLYGGDRNIFIFRVNPNMRLDDGTDGGLGRGFFVRNSEVGDAYFELIAFWYRYVCGNHIVWGAENVTQKRIKHIGRGKARAFDALANDLDTLAKTDMKREEAIVVKAKRMELGATEEEVVDTVYTKFGKSITRKNAANAYLMAANYSDIDGSPRTAWGFAQGITRLSQKSDFADERTQLDRAAGEILDLAARN